MKKILVLAFCAILILAFASVSMAANVTVGGEFNFGKGWSEAGDFQNINGLESNVNNAKVTFNSLIAEDVNAFVALKSDPGNNPSWSVNVDEAWVQFAEDYGTVKVGYFGYNQDQKDIIDDVIPDLKSELTVFYTGKLTDQLTLNLAATNGPSEIGSAWDVLHLPSAHGLHYSVGLAYDTDNLGISANYFKHPGLDVVFPHTSNDQFTAFSVIGYIKTDAIKFYTQYENNNYWWTLVSSGAHFLRYNGNGVQNFIIGAVYDSADVPLFVRAEYDFNDQHTGVNEWALRLAYKMTANLKFQYTIMRHNLYYADFSTFPVIVDNYTTNELLLIATF